MNKAKALSGIHKTTKLLDAKIPKWRLLIDMDTLDLLGTTHDCPCGQIFGEYEKGLDELGILPEDAEHYAFQLLIEPEDEPAYSREYSKLTELWKGVL